VLSLQRLLGLVVNFESQRDGENQLNFSAYVGETEADGTGAPAGKN